MKVTVCELSNDLASMDTQWQALIAHTHAEESEFVLLPEMPFYEWLPASRVVDPNEWNRSVAAHDRWAARFEELRATTIVGTRPIVDAGTRYNAGFVWSTEHGEQHVHEKHYLPDEEGFWEATWYARGRTDFPPCRLSDVTLGFAICTELWFFQHARAYGKQGVQMLACPRATPRGTVEKWIAGGRVAAVVSGAYCLSSNFTGDAKIVDQWAGSGWIIEPEEGRVLGTTCPEAPFLTLDIDIAAADAAKRTYPRYVLDEERQ